MMIELEYEMAYAETIEGPLGPTTGLIRSSERFLAALGSGEATEFEDQYMRIAPHLASSELVHVQTRCPRTAAIASAKSPGLDAGQAAMGLAEVDGGQFVG